MIVTIVSPEDCKGCAELKAELESLKSRYPDLKVEHIDALSPEGEKLILQRGILSSPGVLIDGKFFGMGTVSMEKLEATIKQAAEAAQT